jgi:hypothetical protein
MRALALLACLAFPAAARAECGGRSEPRWMAHQTLVLLLNPMGAELSSRAGLCVPLYSSNDAAFEANHFESGAALAISPVYAIGGGYVQIAPATFFFLRAQIHAIGIWPLPLDGAGYFPRASYADLWRDEDVPSEASSSAGGWGVRVYAVLRGRIEPSPGVAVLALDAIWIDWAEAGAAPFWLDVRHDVIGAQRDWILANEGVLLVASKIPDGPELRFGAYTALRAVPSAGYVGHQLGPIAMAQWDRPDPAIDGLGIFVRLGIYTHHAFRAVELATMAGLDVDWDLGAL